jgi:hypothetical protein
MQPARHIVVFISSPLNCPCVFNAADEAELCSRPENYGRNPYSSIWPQRIQVERPVAGKRPGRGDEPSANNGLVKA